MIVRVVKESGLVRCQHCDEPVALVGLGWPRFFAKCVKPGCPNTNMIPLVVDAPPPRAA